MTKTTYRNAKKEKFTPISNSLLWDKEASLQAKGLLPIFLSNSDEWKLNMKEIVKRSKNGRDAHYKVVNELIELGYFARVQIIDPVNNHFEEMVYIFSDIKQEVADEIENIEKWAEENGKKLVIEYKTKKDKKSTNQENPPLPENQEMEEEPFPDFQETESQNSANQYINNTKDKNINLNNTNLEEEEVSSHSELISFLLSNDITKENAVKFETRLLEESLTGYTNDQVLEAIEWSLYQFVEGKCDEPYIYAVGRLKRVLDNKVKKVTNKPKQQKGTGFTRKEMLPNWFDETKQTTPVAQVENLSDQKAEIERMLQELRT